MPIGVFIFSWIGKMPLTLSTFDECQKFNPFVKQFNRFQSYIKLMKKVRILKFFPYLSQLKAADEYVHMQRFLIKKATDNYNTVKP